MKEKKSIVTFVGTTFLPAVNGGQKGILGYQEYLCQLAQVITFSTTANDENISTPIQLIRGFADKKWKYFHPFVAVKLYQICRKYRPTSLLMEQPYGGIMAWIVARLSGVKWVVYARNIEYVRFKSYGKWWWIFLFPLEYFVFKFCDKILFVSYDELEYINRHLGIPLEKCIYSAHGTHHKSIPPTPKQTKEEIAQKYGFNPLDKWFIFYGLQNYQPNWEAVLEIIEKIAPLCQKRLSVPFHFLIAGGGLPQAIQEKIQKSNLPVTYLGFVEDIDSLVQYASVMVNPIYSGGGVKTKVIEAIALNTAVVSYHTGSLGMYRQACGEKLLVVPDKDIPAFVNTIIKALDTNVNTPDSFYQEYFWGNIVRKYPYLS